MWKTASVLVGCVLLLLTLGIVMLASASGVSAAARYADSLYFVKKQIVWLAIAIIAGAVVSRLDYHVFRAAAAPLGIFCVILLAMTIIPGVGVSIKGAQRWLRFGPMNIQPSEFAKPVVIILLSWWMVRVQRHRHELKKGLLIPLGMLGLILGLIFVEPDFGTTLLVGVVGMSLLFVAGVRVSYLMITAIIGLTLFSFAMMKNAERMRRIVAFLNPEKYRDNEAFQLLSAIDAFVLGGAGGVGLGQSIQKHFYLPEAHTDFIFAIIGEELGIAASISVVLLFLVIFFCGMHISLRASDEFGKLLGFGMTLMITLQAAINIGVVTGCLPTKGLSLPFISSGGSNLVVSLLMVGILVNIARQSHIRGEVDDLGIKDQAHWI